ncbi:hypothetical protein TNCV_1488071 [Trichonephila clavipes]|nr:hypothetical protein TNCV_1488071 [Trichonephila clavipes]
MKKEGLNSTSVDEEFGIKKSVISRSWKAFQTERTAVRNVDGGHPTKTTGMDDLKINSPIPVSLLSNRKIHVAIRLHKSSLLPQYPSHCISLKVRHH